MSDPSNARNPEPETNQEAAPWSPATTTFNILFVCTGNTCRSPLAEGIARDELDRRGWSHVQVRSAGVAAYPGVEATAEAVTVARAHGVDISTHRSQPLTPELVRWADVVLAMGPSHLSGVSRLGGAEKGSTLGDFAAGGDGLGVAVQDPFGGNEAVYEGTYQELRKLISAALSRLAPILHP